MVDILPLRVVSMCRKYFSIRAYTVRRRRRRKKKKKEKKKKGGGGWGGEEGNENESYRNLKPRAQASESGKHETLQFDEQSRRRPC